MDSEHAKKSYKTLVRDKQKRFQFARFCAKMRQFLPLNCGMLTQTNLL